MKRGRGRPRSGKQPYSLKPHLSPEAVKYLEGMGNKSECVARLIELHASIHNYSYGDAWDVVLSEPVQLELL